MTDISALEAYAGLLSEAAQRSDAVSKLQHRFMHGDVDEVIQTESGPLPSLAKWRQDLALLETLLADSSKGVRMVTGATVNLGALVDLRAWKGRRAGDTAAIQSFGSGWAMNALYPFPSGGGEFVWDATSTAAVIVGMVEQVTGEAVGRWKRKFSGAVHVTWTGAIPDGLTKCSAAVQIAVDNYAAVYFPPGKFVLDKANSHSMIYTPTLVDCGVKITSSQKCKELYGAGEATLLLSEPGVIYLALISMYNVTDRSVHSFNMDGLYDRSGPGFKAAISGIRQQSIRRCSTHDLKITNFSYHCLAIYGGSDAITEPACSWNKYDNLYLDGGGQTSLLLYSAAFNGLVLPNEFNEFSNIHAMGSHIYFGIEVRKSNNNTFVNITTNNNQKGGVNLEEGASNNKFVNVVSKYNQYGLHMTGNGVANIFGNRFVNFDFSENISHNVLAYQGAVGNYFTGGKFNNAVNGNGWRSEDTSSFGNYFRDVECKNNPGEGFLFQNTEYLTDAEITGNGLRGFTAFGKTRLRRVTSRNNGTDLMAVIGADVDAKDCEFGVKHAVSFLGSAEAGKFVMTHQCGRYLSGTGVVTEELAVGSLSPLVWRTSVQYAAFASFPIWMYANSGFTSVVVKMRVQSNGAVALNLRDIYGAGTNINVPAVTGWQWVTLTIPLAGLPADRTVKLRFESASGWMMFDGYQVAFV